MTLLPEHCLGATEIIDSEHPAVVDFAGQYGMGENDREKAIALYYAVRDKIAYNPYHVILNSQALAASTAITSRRGWCVSKAILLTAVCRAAGIPAGLGYADVKNHITTQRLTEMMGSDIFYWHSYSCLWIDEQWVKATPAFNRQLCRRFKIQSAEFDGRQDSIFHPFDEQGKRHMEYLQFRGEFADVPLADIVDTYRQCYPTLMKG